MNDRFPFMRVYKEMAEALAKEDRADFYDALIEYALDDKEPEPSTGAAVFQAARRMVDKWKQTAAAGRKRAESAGRSQDGRWNSAGSGKPAKEEKNKRIKDKYINTHIKKNKEKNIVINDDIRKEPRPEAADRVPKAENVMELFNSICASLPKAAKITDTRRAAINARLKDNSPSAFREVFEKAEASDFLSGRSGRWRADFDWLLKSANWQKVLEGNYDNRGRPKQQDAVDSLRASLNISDEERAEAIRLG